jgi:hypothetical protein
MIEPAQVVAHASRGVEHRGNRLQIRDASMKAEQVKA